MDTIQYMGRTWTVMTLKQFALLNEARNWNAPIGTRTVSVADLEWEI